MSETEAPRLTDAEAEAEGALALEPQLTWVAVDEHENYKGSKEATLYIVHPDAEVAWLFRAARWSFPAEMCPTLSQTAAEAKAACERHYVAGRWQ